MNGGSGRCLCGAVRYVFEGAPNWQAHCHCESCRRATASPFTSFLGVAHAGFRWTDSLPAQYESSPDVLRFFCPDCGTPMAYQSPTRTDEIDLFAATLDNPSSYTPTQHVHWNERLPWLKIADGLPVRRAPRRMTATDDPGPVLTLVREAFAYMDGVIDPPSSVHRLTTETVARQIVSGEVWTLDEAGDPIACVFLTPEDDRLYIGKLAVAEAFRGQGLARQLVELAERRAREAGLPKLELQSRVELGANHRAFEAMGFRKIGERAHEGYDRPTSFLFAKDL